MSKKGKHLEMSVTAVFLAISSPCLTPSSPTGALIAVHWPSESLGVKFAKQLIGSIGTIHPIFSSTILVFRTTVKALLQIEIRLTCLGSEQVFQTHMREGGIGSFPYYRGGNVDPLACHVPYPWCSWWQTIGPLRSTALVYWIVDLMKSMML
jgi:hypothetical protein